MQSVHSPAAAVPLSRQANFSEIPVISLSALGRGDRSFPARMACAIVSTSARRCFEVERKPRDQSVV